MGCDVSKLALCSAPERPWPWHFVRSCPRTPPRRWDGGCLWRSCVSGRWQHHQVSYLLHTIPGCTRGQNRPSEYCLHWYDLYQPGTYSSSVQVAPTLHGTESGAVQTPTRGPPGQQLEWGGCPGDGRAPGHLAHGELQSGQVYCGQFGGSQHFPVYSSPLTGTCLAAELIHDFLNIFVSEKLEAYIKFYEKNSWGGGGGGRRDVPDWRDQDQVDPEQAQPG